MIETSVTIKRKNWDTVLHTPEKKLEGINFNSVDPKHQWSS